MKKYLVPFLLVFTTHVQAQKLEGNKADLDQILKNITQFSSYVMAGEHEKIGAAYTADAKIFPQRSDIIAGREAIANYWKRPAGSETSYHKITPSEIRVNGNEAYDYGYYEGKTKRANGSESSWRGKYVIVWKKVDGNWLIYLDMWSSLK